MTMSIDFATLEPEAKPATAPIETRSGNADQGNAAQPIRVCYVIDRLAPGGTELQLLALIKHLDRQRFTPTLCLLDGLDSNSQALEPENCPVIRLGVNSLLRPHGWRALWRLKRFLRQHAIDVVQVYFADSTLLAVGSAWLARVPSVVRTRRDLVYWKSARQRRYGRLLDGIYNRFRVDAMVTNSQACRQSVLETEHPAPRRIEVIPNGVDLTRFEFSNDEPRSDRISPLVGMVAMLRPEKRIDLFIEAAELVARRYPNAQFRIAGEGRERSSLMSLAERLGIADRVRLVGKAGNVPEFLRDLDVAVLCSDSEGLPNAVLEYMAAARPIVATRVGGTPELIQDGVNGLLVAPGDKHQLADAICRVLDDPALALRLSTSAKICSQCFSMQAMVERYQALYHELSATSRRRRSGARA